MMLKLKAFLKEKNRDFHSKEKIEINRKLCRQNTEENINFFAIYKLILNP